MQGNLDLPPVIISTSRATSARMLLIAVVFVAIGAFMLRDPHESRWFAWLMMGFFGLGIPLFGWRLLRPDQLRLAPDGLTWRSALRTSRFRWDELGNFRAFSPGGMTESKHLGFDFTESYRGQGGGARRTAKAMTGVEGAFGDGWELSAAELAELLNKARAKWAGRGRSSA
jgi:hypothetical protein